MKKYIIGIPIIMLLISLAVLPFFAVKNQSQANIGVSGDICATTDNSSSSDSPQIEAVTSEYTAESGKEYAVIEFTG